MSGNRKDRSNDHRCAGLYGSKYKKDPDLIGTQCRTMIPPDREFCARHFVPDERRCTANYAKSNPNPEKVGKRCVCWAMRGQKVCGIHGGRTRQAKAAAARRIAKEKLEKQVAKFLEANGYAAVTNPLEELQAVAGETVAIKDYLRGFVQKIEEIRYQGNSGEQIRGELQVYQAALRDTVNVLATMARLDIDGRLVRIEEAKAALLIAAVNGALLDAAVSGELAQRIRDALADRLEAIEQS